MISIQKLEALLIFLFPRFIHTKYDQDIVDYCGTNFVLILVPLFRWKFCVLFQNNCTHNNFIHKLSFNTVLSHLSFKYFLLVSVRSSWSVLGCNPTASNVTSMLPFYERCLVLPYVDRNSWVSSNICCILVLCSLDENQGVPINFVAQFHSWMWLSGDCNFYSFYLVL